MRFAPFTHMAWAKAPPPGIEIDLSRERVRMRVRYTIPVEFPGYTYQWHFRQKLDRTIFIV